MSQPTGDVQVLRELAREVMAAAVQPKYAERRRLWTAHNSLQRTRPLVLVSCGRWAAFEYEIMRCST